MRILVNPERLRETARQMHAVVQEIEGAGQRVERALTSLDWEAREKAEVAQHLDTARSQLRAVVDGGGANVERMHRAADAFDAADRQSETELRQAAANVLSAIQTGLSGLGAFASFPGIVDSIRDLGGIVGDLLDQEPSPLPRIYIINGITEDNLPEGADLYEDSPLGNRSEQMRDFLLRNTPGHRGIVEDYEGQYVVATMEIYNRYDDDMGQLGGRRHDASDVSDEFHQGSDGRYTQLEYRWITQHISDNPLLPNQNVILIGHSGGGAVASNLVPMLDGDQAAREDGSQAPLRVEGLVTMGSPFVHWDRAEAAHTVMITNRGDAVGDPPAGAGEHAGRPDAGGRVIRDFRPDGRGEYEEMQLGGGSYANPVNRHNAYMTSERVFNVIGQEFPQFQQYSDPD